VRILAAALLATFATVSIAEAASKSTAILWGINDSGLDFGNGMVAWRNYAIPDPSYYLAHGVKLVRVPFQIARIQPTPGGPLSADIVGDLKKIIAKDHVAGAITVLDPHGYAFYPMVGKPQDILKDPAAAANYVDLMRRIAETFAHDDVAIDLMNEPHTGADTDYAVIWNQAIAVIRKAGFQGVILVPHGHWSAAHDISPKTPFLGKIVDPGNNWVLEVHSYLDPDGSGTYRKPVASATIGVERLAGAIAWSRQSGVRLFLGETGAPPDAPGVAALTAMLGSIAAAPDVFWGVALWGAGPWWKPNYPMRLDPIDGVDRPQFVALEHAMASR
jgi:endoglucanase